MLALLPDLPILTPGDVRELIDQPAPAVVAPDRLEAGTNALVLDLHGPAKHVQFTIGAGRAARQIAEFERLELNWSTVATQGLRQDLDTPADWDGLPGSAQAASLARSDRPAACATE